MLGAVAGDIIGSPYEWNNTQDRYFELCRGTRGWFRGREVTYHPKFTDDTVMTLAVARWLMNDHERNASSLISIKNVFMKLNTLTAGLLRRSSVGSSATTQDRTTATAMVRP